MKPYLIIPICLFLLGFSVHKIKAQDTGVEKSLYGIQTGFWGVWVYNESKLSSKWVLRSEVGLVDYLGLAEGLHFEPVITLAPRWYYNQGKRVVKGKRIDANSGSFVALKTRLRPDIFSIPVDTYREGKNLSISFVPTIGTRKNIGEKFNYEIGFGLGIEYFSQGGAGFELVSDEDPDNDKFGPAFNLHLRIGYKL